MPVQESSTTTHCAAVTPLKSKMMARIMVCLARSSREATVAKRLPLNKQLCLVPSLLLRYSPP
jgi:hypothetical protein